MKQQRRKMKIQKTKSNKKKTTKILQKEINMKIAKNASAKALLKKQNQVATSEAIRNSKIPLKDTVSKILKHPNNKGKTPDEIIDILSEQTRKGKGGEAIVATSFNENSLSKGKLNPYSKQPGNVFAEVNPKHNETGKDILIKKINKKGKVVEIGSQEVKTGSREYALKQSESGKYKSVVTNKENIKGLPNEGKMKKTMQKNEISSKPYSEKEAVKKTKKVLKKQFKNEPAVSKLDECKIVGSEAGKAAGKSALISGGVTATIEIGTTLIKGKKINLKKVGKKTINSAKEGAFDAGLKTVATKGVEKVILSNAGKNIAKKAIGKTASKALTKNVGKIAGPAGGFIIDSAVDVVQCARGKQDIKTAVKSVSLNAINAGLYATFPVAGAAMTLGRIGYSFFS